jgi:general secretion pathway protein D
MKRLFASVFVSFSAFGLPAMAAPVSFSFASVPLVQFAQATYRDLLHRDFVVSSDLVGVGKKVTINVKAVDSEKLPAFIDQVLVSQGIRSTLRGGVYYLEPAGVAGSVEDQVDQLRTDAGSHAAPAAAPGTEPPKLVDQVKPQFRVVQVMNRPVEFMVAALNAAVGQPVARAGGGSRLVLSAAPDQFDQVVDLVGQLDVAADQVEVSASFVEVTTNASESSGLSLVAATLSRKLGLSVQPGDGRISLSAGRYDLVLDALAGDGRFNQVSNSRVVGDDSERLSLSVGDETPTIGSSGKDQLGNAVQNVVYRPSGVILDVQPRVLGSSRLSLVVDGQVSAFQATTNGVSTSPTLVKRQVKTSVSLRNGEVLVIGGLNDSKATKAKSGFSFLPSTWSNRNGSESKTDLVLILSARVLSPERKQPL